MVSRIKHESARQLGLLLLFFAINNYVEMVKMTDGMVVHMFAPCEDNLRLQNYEREMGENCIH